MPGIMPPLPDVSDRWDIGVASFCLAGLAMTVYDVQVAVAAPNAPLSVAAQVAIKLIDQLPAIIQALGILFVAILGLYNARKLNQVQTQTDGHMTKLLAKNDEMQKMQTSLAAALAASVPASAVTDAVVAASADRTERAGVRATDRLERGGDRRADAPPLKVALVSIPPEVVPPTPTPPVSPEPEEPT